MLYCFLVMLTHQRLHMSFKSARQLVYLLLDLYLELIVLLLNLLVHLLLDHVKCLLSQNIHRLLRLFFHEVWWIIAFGRSTHFALKLSFYQFLYMQSLGRISMLQKLYFSCEFIRIFHFNLQFLRGGNHLFLRRSLRLFLLNRLIWVHVL